MDNEPLRQKLMTRWALKYIIYATIGVLGIILIIWRLRNPNKTLRTITIIFSIITISLAVLYYLDKWNLYYNN
jgi:hypothetical protein